MRLMLLVLWIFSPSYALAEFVEPIVIKVNLDGLEDGFYSTYRSYKPDGTLSGSRGHNVNPVNEYLHFNYNLFPRFPGPTDHQSLFIGFKAREYDEDGYLAKIFTGDEPLNYLYYPAKHIVAKICRGECASHEPDFHWDPDTKIMSSGDPERQDRHLVKRLFDPTNFAFPGYTISEHKVESIFNSRTIRKNECYETASEVFCRRDYKEYTLGPDELSSHIVTDATYAVYKREFYFRSQLVATRFSVLTKTVRPVENTDISEDTTYDDYGRPTKYLRSFNNSDHHFQRIYEYTDKTVTVKTYDKKPSEDWVMFEKSVVTAPTFVLQGFHNATFGIYGF